MLVRGTCRLKVYISEYDHKINDFILSGEMDLDCMNVYVYHFFFEKDTNNIYSISNKFNR